MRPEFLLDMEAAEFIAALARHQGKKGDEVAVLLAGAPRTGGHILLDRVIIPRQMAFQTPRGCGLIIDGGCLNRVGPQMRASGRRIHGILHSHPDEAYHSPTDNAAVLMRFHRAFSIVVPEFGRRADLLNGSCAFRFDYAAGWQEAARRELIGIEKIGPFEVIHDE